jgi:delta 1-pyrroline-5-carboxylate dehydrogenase
MSGQIYLNASTKANLAESVGPNASILTILAATLAAPVDEATRRRAASHVLDWLGSTVMGAMRHGAAGFRASIAANATGPSRVIGAGRTDWWSALQVNAALGNIMEMDDLHRTSILHPGPVIVPGAIAVAEHIGATGEALLDAIDALGYGLTLGVHSRIDTTIDRIVARLETGNCYINRSMIGAVVGTQPFGGEGMSGSGFIAGGPNYLLKFVTERVYTQDTTAAG